MLSRHHLERGGEILSLTPGWILLSSFGARWGDSFTRHHAPNDDAICPVSKRISPPCSLVIQSVVWRFSYSPQAGLSRRCFAHGGEILLLAPGWTSLLIIRYVMGRFSYSPKLRICGCCSARDGEVLLLAAGWTSLVVVQCVLGRFSYSPQARHLWSLFGTW